MTLGYAEMRKKWCKAALASLLRRWGIYLLVGVAVLSGNHSAFVEAATALVAWVVLPLFKATAHADSAMLALSGYVLVSGVLVWALGPMLWPRHWGEAERALPIDPAARRASDVHVVCLALVPLMAAYVAGAMVWFVKSPQWFVPLRWRAVAALIVLAVLSVAAGVRLLAWRRNLPVTRVAMAKLNARRPVLGAGVDLRGAVSFGMALVVLPLVRGMAHRSARFLLGATGVLLVFAGGIVLAPPFTGWWLAGYALAAQILITRLNVLVRMELGGLHAECGHLPVPPHALALWRYAVVLAPMLVAHAALALALLSGSLAMRWSVFSMFLSAVLVGNGVLAHAANTPARTRAKPDDSARVSWWLLFLVVALALASEVVA